MNQPLTQARLAAAEAVYTVYDFLDARDEGRFEWASDADERGAHRLVFLAPVEAEDGVEMVTFHVRFADAESNVVADTFCITSTGNRYGRPGNEEARRQSQLRALGELTESGQRMGLYD